MLKKIMCLILALTMVLAIIMLTGCEVETEEVVSSRLPMTLNIVGITNDSTTQEAIKAVEEAINEITMSTFKTKINLTLVTEEEYYDEILNRIEIAEKNALVSDAITQYNKYAQKVANQLSAQQSSSSSGLGKWRRGNVIVQAETIATSGPYTKEMTTRDEYGNITTLYPEATSPVDIVMILGKDMYDYFDEINLLKNVASLITSGSSITDYKQFEQFIYPTFFSELKSITNGVKAIPTNHLLAKYTYLAVDAELAEKYGLNIDKVSNYADLDEFLAQVKENETDYIPLGNIPDALGIFYPFGEDVAIATYVDPIDGYKPDEGKSFKIQNLFDIPQYQNHVKLIDEYQNKGYFESSNDGKKIAVKVIVGDSSVVAQETENYEYKILQSPFVTVDDIFAGMMGVTEYTSSDIRSLEIIQAFNTNSKLKNLLQYGIEGVNYEVNKADNTIKRLNYDYLMNTMLTGNLFVGYPEEGLDGNLWTYHKETNRKSQVSPLLVYYLDEKVLEEKLTQFIYRAEVSEALHDVIGITYAEFEASNKTSAYTKYVNQLKAAYKPYLIQCLLDDGIKQNAVESAFNGSIKTGEWYVNKIAEKIGESHPEYSKIATDGMIIKLIQNKIGEDLNIAYFSSENKTRSYETYKKNAEKYYQNIEFLRIMVDLLYDDLTEEEKNAYDNMTNKEFEENIVEYVKKNYIKEHNLSDSDYEELVKQYITSELSFYDDFNNSYTITWADIEAKQKASQSFIKGVDKLKEEYADLLSTSYGFDSVNIEYRSPIEIIEELYSILYKQYLSENGYTVISFQDELYDKILEPFNIKKTELDKLRTTNILDYNNYISRIKSKYKNEILETYTLEKYRDNTSSALTASEILKAVLDSYIEEATNIYHTIANKAGLSYGAFVEGRTNCKEYVRYVNSVRTNFIYTLKSYYPDLDTNKIKYEDILDVTYEAVYNYGYYTNEMAKLVGLTLSDYSNNKSQAQNYINQLNSLINIYKSDIKALGYDIDEFSKKDPNEIEAVIYSIINEKYFSGMMNIMDYLHISSESYIDELETAEDKIIYMKNVVEQYKNNYLFNAIIDALEEEFVEKNSN